MNAFVVVVGGICLLVFGAFWLWAIQFQDSNDHDPYDSDLPIDKQEDLP